MGGSREGSHVHMQYFVQQLINGLTLGSIYGLIAIGYTMVYGIIGMINFAHGDIFMVGAFIALIVFLISAALGFSSVPASLLLIVLIVACSSPRSVELDHRARRLPAAARFVPAGAADHRDRHVDLLSNFVQVRRARATSRCRRWSSGVYELMRRHFGVALAYKQIVIVVVTVVLLAVFWYAGQQDPARPRAARLRAGPQDGGAARHRRRPHHLDHLRHRRRARRRRRHACT